MAEWYRLYWCFRVSFDTLLCVLFHFLSALRQAVFRHRRLSVNQGELRLSLGLVMSGAYLFKRERSVELYSVMRSSTEDGEFVISSEVSKSEMKSGTCTELILRKD